MKGQIMAKDKGKKKSDEKVQKKGKGGGSGEFAKPSEAPVAAPPTAIGTTGNAGTAANPALSGMSGDTLRSLWGEPTLKRAETGAELWQYSGQGGCTLLVYLYSSAGSAMIVSHAEASPGGADEAAIAACAKASGKPPLKPIS